MKTTSRVLLIAMTLALSGKTILADDSPNPADPYPLKAAGWGPETGDGLYYSRWVEDWTALRAADKAPSLKALPVGKGMSLTLSTETRLRLDSFRNGQLVGGDNYQQALFRNVLGADLRVTPGVRLFGEIGSGHVSGRRATAGANFENDQSLQQLFIDARTTIGSAMAGAMIGRQEFADGPRQLVSLSDGPNLHRTWNGARLFFHGTRVRLGGFDLRATRLAGGGFDEKIDHGERLQGLNASLVLTRESGEASIFLEPFWLHSTNPALRSGTDMGHDERDTYGARIWGQRGELKFDVTAVRQEGRYIGRDVEAWALFAVQSLTFTHRGWKPRLTAHVDLASGASTAADGKYRGFNPLYSSSNYLGEGRFLGLGNLFLVAPGLTVTPRPSTNLSVEYGFAQRLDEEEAVLAGGLRAYSGTREALGRDIGGLLRLTGSWTGRWPGDTHVTLSGNYEYLSAGSTLRSAHHSSGSYAYISATFRY